MAKESAHVFGDAERKELLRLIDAVRDVIASSVSLDAPAATLAHLADEITAVGRELARHKGARPFPRYAPVDSGDPNASIPFSPITGRYNPLSPPVELSVEGESDKRIVGRVSFSDVYEGPPSAVHGSIVASVYDQILAIANLANGVGGPTASLTVTYKRLTPLHTPLRFEAWTDRIDGRKVWARGRCHAGDELVSESEGLFICMHPEQAQKFRSGLRKMEGGDA